MHAGDAPSPGHLPRLVFFAFIGVTVLGILGLVCYSIVTGWVPPRSFAGTYTRVVLPAYFAALLATLTLSYVISGNTLMHRYRTGLCSATAVPPGFGGSSWYRRWQQSPWLSSPASTRAP
jgi:hypothetical protein